ncbi:acyl-CoA carboxylase subunit epsilon [Actinoallomurus sp. NPDC050550]|uniref:acyl-CoA carboxylase subunit epsilon n=1 Tax=Actinoallomurus sp. NPDC050550 TaxID=3154937 RepID=UPI0033F978A0
MSERPFLQVVRGDASPEEIAALVAVLTARARAAEAAGATPPPRRSAWADRSRQLRRPLPHGPGAWRTSTLP